MRVGLRRVGGGEEDYKGLDMGDEYGKIEKVGSEFYEWYKGILLKERLL